MKPDRNPGIPSILLEEQYNSCRLCPRQCGVDRTAHRGYCRCSDQITVARAALHQWEEPCISGTFPDGVSGRSANAGNVVHDRSTNTGSAHSEPADTSAVSRGSGTVFFSGCTLGCCFCQNYSISHERFGREITVRQLADIFLRLQDQGAFNINLVTATQYLPSVIKALDMVRNRLTIPVVYNCGGYERREIVYALSDYVDIWLPDLKYLDPSLAARYSQARDYFTYASQAIPQMIAQTGAPVMDENGLLRSGVIVRHMVLPGSRADSIRLLHWMKENLPDGKWLLSLMSQYTPAGEAAIPAAVPKTRPSVSGTDDICSGSRAFPAADQRFPELSRRITTFEYESVLNTAIDLGLTTGYMQLKSSAKEEYTPPFDLTGI